MSPEQVRNIVEDYPNLINKIQKAQNRLGRMSGKNPEQEMGILEQLDAWERSFDFINRAIDEEINISTREAFILDLRAHGHTYEQIGDMCYLSTERIRQILNTTYKKMAREFS